MINDYFSIEDTYNTILSIFSKDFTINNVIKQGLLKEINDANSSIDEKYLLTDIELSQGNIIKYNNMNYMIITKNENINNIYNKYTIRKCPYTVNFSINTSMNVVTGYIETKTLDTQTSQYVILPVGTIVVTVPLDSITEQIKINDRFIKMKSAWKITGLDKSLEGLIKITAEKDSIASGDDLVDEIPEGSYFYNYSMAVSPTEINIDAGATQQIITTITNDGNIISDPTLTYSSSDENVATVDETGIVSGIGEGNTNVTVSFLGGDGITYTKTIPTTVNAVVVKTIKFTTTYDDTGEITSQLKLLNGDTANITVYAYQGSTQTSDQFTLTTSLYGGDSSYYTLTIIDGNNFTVKNIKGDGGEYLTVTCTDNTDSTSESIEIRLAGEW